MTVYPKYSPHQQCPKCNSRDHEVDYSALGCAEDVNSALTLRNEPTVDGETMVVTCMTCGYKSITRPVDFQED